MRPVSLFRFRFFLPARGQRAEVRRPGSQDNVKTFAILVLPHGSNLRPEAGLSGTVLGTDIADMVDLMGWMGFGLRVFHKPFVSG